MEVEEARTHFRIKDPVLGGTLSCLVVLDFSCRHIFFIIIIVSVGERRKKQGLCRYIDLMN